MELNNGISITDAMSLLSQRSGQPPTRKTVYRWIARGCRGVKLGAWREGGLWFTSVAEINRFVAELSGKSRDASNEPISLRPADKARHDKAVKEYLERKGIHGNRSRTKWEKNCKTA